MQLAAFTAGYTLKKKHLPVYTYDYAILGDDIVIADKRVAASYKRILSILDVGFSLPKS